MSTSVAKGEDYTPDHKVVKQMVQRGVDFLSTAPPSMDLPSIGYDLLVAYAILKATEDHDHRFVRASIPKALNYAKEIRREKSVVLTNQHVNYHTAVAGMFLSALDPVKYRQELENIRDHFIDRQRQNGPKGSFGYLGGDHGATGDVSQTQYAALSLWSIKQAKIEIDPKVLEDLVIWLSQVQKNGGWTYQAPSPESPNHSMTAAGLSATLLGADALGLLRGSGATFMENGDDDDGVPGAFHRVADAPKKVFSKNIARNRIEAMVKDSERWLKSNPYRRGGDWYYYLLYSQERYESFLELFYGKREKSPGWYNATVESLKKSQSKDGAWGVDDPDPVGGPKISTSFAILFLLRNTQKSIGDLKTADSVGGYGLTNVAEVGFVDGKLVDKSQLTSIEDAIKLLESNQEGSTEDKLLADRMVLDPDPKKKKGQLNRFARLLRSPDTRARRVAAKLLGRGDDLDFVPDLIYALSEGEQDGQVLRLAENSLRILSRQLTTYILPREGPVTASDRVKAERYWQNWFLSIRPDHVFINQ